MEASILSFLGQLISAIVAFYAGKKVATADLTTQAFKEVDKKLTQQAEQKIADNLAIANLRTMLYAERVRNGAKVSDLQTTSMQPEGSKPGS